MKKLNLLILGALFISTQSKAQHVLEALDSPVFIPSDRCLELVKDKHYGDGVHDFIYCTVKGPDGRIWLNNNLGAEYANTKSSSYNPEQTATSNLDYKAYGSLFQNGRKADGHELVIWKSHNDAAHKNPTTTQLFPSLTDTNNRFSARVYPDGPDKGEYVERWYRKALENWTDIYNLWNGQKVNNPCPDGFSIPSFSEMKNLLSKVSVNNSNRGEPLLLKDKDWNLLLPPYKDMGTTKTFCWNNNCYTHTANKFRYTTGQIRIRDIYNGSPSLTYRFNMNPYQELETRRSIVVGTNDKNDIRFGVIDWGEYVLTAKDRTASAYFDYNLNEEEKQGHTLTTDADFTITSNVGLDGVAIRCIKD